MTLSAAETQSATTTPAGGGSPRVTILGATFNTGNRGVSMLAAGAIQCVLHRFPQASIDMLDYGYTGYSFDFKYNERTVPIRFVNLRFSKKFYLANNIALLIGLALVSKLIPLRAVRQWLLSRNPWMREIMETDVACAVSGGDSFSDIYGIGRFLYVALPQLLMLLTNRRLVLLPQTIGPFQSPLVTRMAKYILDRAEIVYCRDHISAGIARKLLDCKAEDQKVRFCYDMAFAVPPVTPKSLDLVGLPSMKGNAHPVVGFNISGLLLSGGYTQDNMFGLKVDYRTMVYDLIRMLIEEKSAIVVLIPHVFGASTSLESDTGACESVFESLGEKYRGRIGLVRGDYKHDEIKHVIGGCDFFLGARMHACIAALSQNIPTVLIAYSDKFAGMAKAIGGGSVIDPRHMESKEIAAAVNAAFDQRDRQRVELEGRMPPIKAAVREALAGLAEPSR